MQSIFSFDVMKNFSYSSFSRNYNRFFIIFICILPFYCLGSDKKGKFPIII